MYYVNEEKLKERKTTAGILNNLPTVAVRIQRQQPHTSHTYCIIMYTYVVKVERHQYQTFMQSGSNEGY